MPLTINLFRIPPDAAVAVLSGDRELGEVDEALGGDWRSAFAPDEPPPQSLDLSGHWDCLWFLLADERRTRPLSWTSRVTTPRSWAVVGRRRTGTHGSFYPADLDQEPSDELRANDPDDVARVAAGLRPVPAVRPADPDALRRVGVYHRGSCSGPPDGLAPEVFATALRSIAAFYEAAAEAGEWTLHSYG